MEKELIIVRDVHSDILTSKEYGEHSSILEELLNYKREDLRKLFTYKIRIQKVFDIKPENFWEAVKVMEEYDDNPEYVTVTVPPTKMGALLFKWREFEELNIKYQVYYLRKQTIKDFEIHWLNYCLHKANKSFELSSVVTESELAYLLKLSDMPLEEKELWAVAMRETGAEGIGNVKDVNEFKERVDYFEEHGYK